MSKFDLVIKGGTIVDGTSAPRFVGDIGIRDGVIAQIGANLAPLAPELSTPAAKSSRRRPDDPRQRAQALVLAQAFLRCALTVPVRVAMHMLASLKGSADPICC